MTEHTQFERAAELIASADGLIITAGAGMGVDSGLPDFRGPGGFWGVYPALGRARIRFEEIANPSAFISHPRLAWGFYGHRLNLYREVEPGPAFGILLDIARRLRNDCFVFTSNVDGHFQKAGFDRDRVIECHGSINHLQCLNQCKSDIWPASTFHPRIDEDAGELLGDLPACPRCGGLARPNILMFGDFGWLDDRASQQWERLALWRQAVERPVVIEIGAGLAVPSVRHFSEMQSRPLIRINPVEPEVLRKTDVGLRMGATQAVQGICGALMEAGFLDK